METHFFREIEALRAEFKPRGRLAVDRAPRLDARRGELL
jgi:hypothetical protein